MKKLDAIKRNIIDAQEQIIIFRKNNWPIRAIRARKILKETRALIQDLERDLLEEKKEVKLKLKKNVVQNH